MMANERSKSTRDNFDKFIHQLQRETKTLIRKLERILIKLYKQNLSLLFNQTYLNEGLLPNYTYISFHIYLIAWMLICDHWFHDVFIQQSSGRKRNILEKLKKNRKNSQKNVYIGIVYNCVCVDYICASSCVLLYV